MSITVGRVPMTLVSCVTAFSGCALLASAIFAGADERPPAAAARVRTTDPTISDLIAEGAERSPTLRQLIQRLDAMHWFVFVERGRCSGHRLPGCLPHLVSVYAGQPMLHVVIDNWGAPTREREIGTIGHELQHALEVAQAPDVVDSATLEMFFRRIGTTTSVSASSTTYETEAAERVGDRIRMELRANRRR